MSAKVTEVDVGDLNAVAGNVPPCGYVARHVSVKNRLILKRSQALELLQKTKIVVVALLAVLIVVIVLQNTEVVETKILFTTISMPRAALLFGTLISGFVIGVLTGGRIMARMKKE